MSGIVIRPANKADAPDLGRLGAMLLETHYAFDPQRFIAPGDNPAAAYAWFLSSQLKEPDVVVMVAEVHGAVVGYVYAALEPRAWKELRDPAGFIHDVVVDLPNRGAGIGAQLVDAAIRWLREHGAPRVILWSAQQNASAQRLFSKMGFRRTMVEMTRELDEGTLSQ